MVWALFKALKKMLLVLILTLILLTIAKNLGHKSFVQNPPYDFTDCSFDSHVLIDNVIEHIFDPTNIIQEIHKFLLKGLCVVEVFLEK